MKRAHTSSGWLSLFKADHVRRDVSTGGLLVFRNLVKRRPFVHNVDVLKNSDLSSNRLLGVLVEHDNIVSQSGRNIAQLQEAFITLGITTVVSDCRGSASIGGLSVSLQNAFYNSDVSEVSVSVSSLTISSISR